MTADGEEDERTVVQDDKKPIYGLNAKDALLFCPPTHLQDRILRGDFCGFLLILRFPHRWYKEDPIPHFLYGSILHIRRNSRLAGHTFPFIPPRENTYIIICDNLILLSTYLLIQIRYRSYSPCTK